MKHFLPVCLLITWFLAALALAEEPKRELNSKAGLLRAATVAKPSLLLAGNGTDSQIPGCMSTSSGDVFDQMQLNFRRIVPDDCQTTRLAPPLFIWTEPRSQPSMSDSVQLRNPALPFEVKVRNSSAAIVATQKTFRAAAAFSATDANWLAGDYTWTIAFTAKSGARVESAARRFRILSGAVALDWPDGNSLAARVAALPFPRPLAAGQTFASLKQRIVASEYALAWDRYQALAQNYLSTVTYPLPIEPTQADQYPPGSAISVAAGLALQSPLQNEQRYIQALAYAYRFTSDDRFRDAALTRLSNIARWSLTGATVVNSDFDLSNRAIYRALAEGLDLLWDEIDPGIRPIWIQAIRMRMQAILKAFDGYASQPYQSHLVGETAIAVETLLHVAGMPGFPEAQAWLAEAWERFRFGFNVWGGEDGGYANGVAYAWFTMENLPSAVAALRVIANVDLSRHPYFGRLGDYLMAFVPPVMNSPGVFSPFGDSTETTTFFAWYVPDYYRLHSALVRDPAQEWYWRANPNTVGSKISGKLSPWHFLLLGLDLPAVQARESSATSYFSSNAGLGALFSRMSDPNRSALYLRSSRFGSVAHSHADQNSFAFDSRGQNMLISSGYYPWYGSPHHIGVTRLTRFKSALTINGGIGQNETVENPLQAPTQPGLTNYSMDNNGQIINFFDSARWGVLTGDASNAYRPRQRLFPYAYGSALVDVALRSAAYDRIERIAVIYDYAKSATPRLWELNFHALSPFLPQASVLRIDRPGAALCVEVLGPRGSFKTSQGFTIAPEKPYPSAQYPEQFHARYSVSKSSLELTSVTILREDCSAARVAVRFDEAAATVSINDGAAIVFDRRQVRVPQ